MRPIGHFYRNPNWKIFSIQTSNQSLTSSNRESTGITREALTKLITEANTNGPTLDLSSRGICDQDTLVLFDILPSCTNIIHLSLSNNKISDIGVRRIFDILNKTSINSLDLSRNPITDIGAQYIINAIQINIFIVKVTLDRKNLSDDILKKLIESIEINTIVQHQIATEVSKTSFYKAVVETISPIFPQELIISIFDYFNENNLPKARAYLQDNFYPKIISWYYPKSLETSSRKEKNEEARLLPAEACETVQLKNKPHTTPKNTIDVCLVS